MLRLLESAGGKCYELVERLCDSSEEANVVVKDEKEKKKSERKSENSEDDGGFTRMRIGGKVGPNIHGSTLFTQASRLNYIRGGSDC